MKTSARLQDFFAERCQRFADKPAFTCLGQTLTYGQVDRLATDLAAFLHHRLNLKPGDRIAVQMPNLLQYPVAVIAALRAGLVVVNTNPLYTQRELRHQLQDSGARAVIVMADFADNLMAVKAETDVEHVIVTQAADLHRQPRRALINTALKLKRALKMKRAPKGDFSLLRALAEGAKAGDVPQIEGEPGDMAVLQYTGGTTGLAKGAVLSHANLLSNVQQVWDFLGHELREGEEILVAPLPLYHIFAFMLTMMLGMGIGARIILIPDPRNRSAFIRTLKGEPFTFFAGLNTLFNALCRADGFRELDFSQLRITVSGGMALTRKTAERWEEVTGCKIIEGYGLTETSPVVSINPLAAPKLGTVGLPLPRTECQLRNDSGEVLPGDEPGELCVRGPQVMKGYWQNDEATQEVLDEEGWLATGDVATIDSDGYVSIVDRIKDMIVVSGFNVYPNELEDTLSAHPDIVECAAVSVPDPDTVEAVKLFVVASNPDLSEKDIRQFARKSLAAYKVPKLIEFVDDLPKSNVGKVLRRELRE